MTVEPFFIAIDQMTPAAFLASDAMKHTGVDPATVRRMTDRWCPVQRGYLLVSEQSGDSRGNVLVTEKEDSVMESVGVLPWRIAEASLDAAIDAGRKALER